MAKARMRRRTMMLGAMVWAAFLVMAGCWISRGCPIGFTVAACNSSISGLDIVASSDHLFSNVRLIADKNSAKLDVEGRTVIVRGGEAVVGDTTRCLIPAGSKQIEFAATGGVLRILADGRLVREIR